MAAKTVIGKYDGPFIGVNSTLDDVAFRELMKDQVSGHDPGGRGRECPGPTRETSNPWAETKSRKPYLPVADMSEPSLDEGVSYRQRID